MNGWIWLSDEIEYCIIRLEDLYYKGCFWVKKMSVYVFECKFEGVLCLVFKIDFCKVLELCFIIVFVCEESLIFKVFDGINRIWGGRFAI